MNSIRNVVSPPYDVYEQKKYMVPTLLLWDRNLNLLLTTTSLDLFRNSVEVESLYDARCEEEGVYNSHCFPLPKGFLKGHPPVFWGSNLYVPVFLNSLKTVCPMNVTYYNKNDPLLPFALEEDWVSGSG